MKKKKKISSLKPEKTIIRHVSHFITTSVCDFTCSSCSITQFHYNSGLISNTHWSIRMVFPFWTICIWILPASSATLLLTADGRFIIQSPQGRDGYISITGDSSQKVANASMLDSGNFVLYNSDQGIIWQSFDHPTTTIVQGQRLSAGTELFSSVSETDQSTGIFRLKMQTDGNLIQYPVGTTDTAGYSYFSSFTDGKGDNVSLNLDDDGHLYLLNSTGFNIRDLYKGEGSDTNGTIYLMKIDSDGIFRRVPMIYTHFLICQEVLYLRIQKRNFISVLACERTTISLVLKKLSKT